MSEDDVGGVAGEQRASKRLATTRAGSMQKAKRAAVAAIVSKRPGRLVRRQPIVESEDGDSGGESSSQVCKERGHGWWGWERGNEVVLQAAGTGGALPLVSNICVGELQNPRQGQLKTEVIRKTI